jgi:hypothetical protein
MRKSSNETLFIPAARIVGRIVLAATALAALGACASIPQRAWRNGEAMAQSRAYQEVLSGNTSFQAHRQLQSSLDPRRLGYWEVPYPAFGQWW